MQTIYYTTTNFVRHTGNVVDLSEYRRKLEMAQEGGLASQVQEVEEDPCLHLAPESVRKSGSRDKKTRRAWVLDICASLGVLVMTLTFTAQVLAM